MRGRLFSYVSLVVTIVCGLVNIKTNSVKIEQPVRMVTYSTDNLYNGEIFDEFEDYEVLENEDGFVINAYQTFSTDEFDDINTLALSANGVRVRYTETYIESESMITIETLVDETNQPIIETIEGLIAENEKEQADIIVGDEDEIFWLSDVVYDEPFDDVGWWNEFKSWLRGVATTVKNVIVKGMRLACKIAVNIIGLNNSVKVLNMWEDSYGNYHADFDCWQQYAGYNNLYDFVFNLGSSMKASQSQFSACDPKKPNKITNYNLWAWKGDYWELGAGAELGFYRQFNSTSLWYVDKKMAIDMKMKVEYYTNYSWKTIIDWDPKDYFSNSNEKEWWITGFNPNYTNSGISESNLRVTYTIKFVTKKYSYLFDDALRDAFKAEWVDDGSHDHQWTYDDSSEEFSFIFE